MSEPMAHTDPPSAPVPPAVISPAPPVSPPRLLLLDAALALGVVGVCASQRHRFLDIQDNWQLALSLVLPLFNLVIAVLSLRGYARREGALQYRMAFGALLTLYYGYLGLHVTGLYESPLGGLLMNAAGSSEHVKYYVGAGLLALLLSTFLATDACQRTLAAMHPPAPVPEKPTPPPAIQQPDAVTVPY